MYLEIRYFFRYWFVPVLAVLSVISDVACLPPVTRNRTGTAEDRLLVCGEKSQMIEDGVCMLFRAETHAAHNSSAYHEIICLKPTEEALLSALETYASAQCALPLKLYIPELTFLPSSKTFHSIVDHLNALTIKNWNPQPIKADLEKMPDSQTTDYDLDGSPFEDMKTLKVLDIEFDSSAKFSLISKHFFDGLDNLEALHIENLPPGAAIAPGIFHEAPRHPTLKCFGFLTSTIPCSCNKDDPGYWLHEWLHRHSHTWAAEGKTKIRYTDELTSDGSFFLCEVKVKCETTEVESTAVLEAKHNKKKVKQFERPFHHFNWKSRCHLTTTAAPTEVPTEPPMETTAIVEELPCQWRLRRSDEGSVQVDVNFDGPCKDNSSHRVIRDEPVVAAQKSAAKSATPGSVDRLVILLLILSGICLLNKNRLL